MIFEYLKDVDGSEILKIDSGNKYLTDYNEVNVYDGEIYISDYLYHSDPYDGNQVSISVEAWEEVKSFVDNQINMKGNRMPSDLHRGILFQKYFEQKEKEWSCYNKSNEDITNAYKRLFDKVYEDVIEERVIKGGSEYIECREFICKSWRDDYE